MNRRSLRQLRVVVRKELTDALRDRRAIFSIVLGIVIGPAIVGFMMNRVADRQRDADDIRVPVVGEEHAPALVAWLRQQVGVTIVAGPADPERAVRDRELDVVLVIPKEFAERFRASRPAEVRIVSDSARNSARPAVARVRGLLERYSGEIGALRLIGRGISPAVITTLQVSNVEVSSAQQRAATVVSFVPMFVLFAAFTGGMQIATDATAGERERGSLEPLLVNPVPRAVLVGGKWLAAVLVGAASVVVTAVLCAAMLRLIPLQELGIRMRLGPLHVAGMLAAAVPMCLLSASLQACVATLARSFKEAQSYMGILILLPMLPGVIGVVYPINGQPWMYAVPVLGHYLLLTDVLSGRATSAMPFVATALVSMVAALLLVRVTTALFRSERIVFGR